jgi:transcriptional regulator with XRE-family HTH domain
MKEMGTTQDALSEQLEMTQGGLQHWLAGTRQPALDDINRIADMLKVPRTWLTHGIGPEDTVDGLSATSKSALQRLIHLERAQALPDTFWAAIEAMANTVAPGKASPDKSHADTRNGTDG